jgi:hypothetical protein
MFPALIPLFPCTSMPPPFPYVAAPLTLHSIVLTSSLLLSVALIQEDAWRAYGKLHGGQVQPRYPGVKTAPPSCCLKVAQSPDALNPLPTLPAPLGLSLSSCVIQL